jgi:protein-S-isoprenylcysteine O-methyltransferase Ste14
MSENDPLSPLDPEEHPATREGDGELDPPAAPFLDRRSRPRRRVESVFVRVVATCGIVGICVAVAAVMGTQSISAWIIGLVVSVVSVVLAAVLWSSRTL